MLPTDDKYRIVEDEFLHTAQKFTAHLHRAEYQRLKTLAASQNADTIRAIERPVVGPATRVTKQRAEMARKNARQRTLTDDPPEVSTGLRGLMESPRREARSIKAFGKAAMGTRAAAGFRSQESPSRRTKEATLKRDTATRAPTVARDRSGSPSTRKSEVPSRRSRGQTADEDIDIDTPDEDSPDDHLGSSSTSQRQGAKATTNARASTFQSTRHASSSTKAISRAKSAPNLKQRACLEPGDTKTQVVTLENEDDDDDDPFGMQKTRMRRAKSRDQMRKPATKESVDLIPSFL